MKNISLWALRAGLSITFIWIGYLVLQNPAGWANSIDPWAAGLLPVSPENFMTVIGYFDIVVGAMLMIPSLTGVAALLGAFHLAGVVSVIGSSGITARDLGLLGASIALAIETFPMAMLRKLFNK